MFLALRVRKHLAIQDKIADSYITIGEYYNNINMRDSAIYYTEAGYLLAKEINDNRLVSISSLTLSKFYEEQKDFEQAYKYLDISRNSSFEIADLENIKEVTREEMEYMFDQERALAETIKEEQMAQLDRDQKIINWATAFSAMSAVSLTIIIILFRKKKRKNQQLRLQRDTLEQRSKLLQMQQDEISQKNQELRATTEMLEERNKELQMLSAVAAYTSNSIYIIDREGKFIWFNDAFSRETHIPFSQLHTHPALQVAAMTPETRAVYERVLETKKTQTYTAEMNHLGGEPFWVQSSGTPLLDEHGEITMIIWVSTNITELHRAYEKIDLQNKEIHESMTYARRIQDAVQPMKIFSDEILGDHFIINMPRNIVSGDFHWVGYKNGLSVFTVADCTGHGVPGAFISMLGQVMLNQTISKLDQITAANILNHVRQGIILQLHQRDKDGALSDSIDASMFVYDRENCMIDYAGAYSHAYILRFGTPDPDTEATCNDTGCKIITDESQPGVYLIRLKPNRMALGIDKRDTIPFTSINLKVAHGDIAYSTTDGFPDQFGGERQKRFNIANFEKLLLRSCRLSMDDQRRMLETTFLEWKGEYEQTDDVHVLGIIL